MKTTIIRVYHVVTNKYADIVPAYGGKQEIARRRLRAYLQHWFDRRRARAEGARS